MTVVDLFELGRRDVAVGFEEAAVVEPVDPFEGGVFEVVEAAPGAAVADELCFVEPDDRLGESVVVGVALRPDRVHRTGLGEPLGVANRDVLNAPVGVMYQLVETLASVGTRPDRLLQRVAVLEAIKGVDIDCTEEYHHPATEDMDENGQGNCHVAYAFVAHRAVVDVDPELGLVKVVQIATAQDVGRVLNPLSAMGQVEGGIAQGLGLAVMEEIIVKDGKVSNPSFTDYLLPTFLDAPVVEMVFIEEHEPKSPLGAKGIGEPPCISVTPAIANAIRQAIGKELPRVPIRPYDICL